MKEVKMNGIERSFLQFLVEVPVPYFSIQIISYATRMNCKNSPTFFDEWPLWFGSCSSNTYKFGILSKDRRTWKQFCKRIPCSSPEPLPWMLKDDHISKLVTCKNNCWFMKKYVYFIFYYRNYRHIFLHQSRGN